MHFPNAPLAIWVLFVLWLRVSGMFAVSHISPRCQCSTQSMVRLNPLNTSCPLRPQVGRGQGCKYCPNLDSPYTSMQTFEPYLFALDYLAVTWPPDLLSEPIARPTLTVAQNCGSKDGSCNGDENAQMRIERSMMEKQF